MMDGLFWVEFLIFRWGPTFELVPQSAAILSTKCTKTKIFKREKGKRLTACYGYDDDENERKKKHGKWGTREECALKESIAPSPTTVSTP